MRNKLARRHRLYVILVSLFLAIATLAGCSAANSAASTSATLPPYLLILGDSLSTGYQPAGGGDLTCTHPAIDKTGHGGWACMLLAKLHSRDASTTVNNFAVNGEDTCDFITGTSCDGRSIGGPVAQQRRARDFLRSHQGSTGVITLDIGADDATSLEAAARQGNNALVLTQLPAVFDRAASNYRRILKRLRQLAPNARIMALGYYIPNLPSFIPKDILPLAQVAINSLARQFNKRIIADAKTFNATYVDLFNPFHGKQAQLLIPGDIHPNDAGQRLIARLVWRAYKT
jgi:lysophospholipase L1-like esterase